MFAVNTKPSRDCARNHHGSLLRVAAVDCDKSDSCTPPWSWTHKPGQLPSALPVWAHKRAKVCMSKMHNRADRFVVDGARRTQGRGLHNIVVTINPVVPHAINTWTARFAFSNAHARLRRCFADASVARYTGLKLAVPLCWGTDRVLSTTRACATCKAKSRAVCCGCLLGKTVRASPAHCARGVQSAIHSVMLAIALRHASVAKQCVDHAGSESLPS